MAPECIEQRSISFKADIFSLGVIITEIITGRRDYPNISETTETSLKHYTDKVRSVLLHAVIFYLMQMPFSDKLLVQMFRWLEVGGTDL